MNLSILIPTFNRKDILFKGLHSLFEAINKIENNSLQINIIVIDDGSKDGTENMLSSSYPEVVVLKGDGNYWWTKAINVGAKHAIEILDSDFLLLWNDDIFPEIDYFINLERIFKDNSTKNIFGSSILDFDTKELWATTMTFNKYSGRTNYLKKGSDKSNHYYWLTGMGLVVSKKVVLELNYWDEKNFPQYFGDLDFTLRASKKKHEIHTLDELVIYNQTEYSSYVGIDLKSFLNSLKSDNIGSRYNMYIRRKLLKMHSESFLWRITYFEFYLKYFIKTFILKKQ